MDFADRSQQIEERERADSLYRHAHTPAETPQCDAAGKRVCVVCLERLDRHRLTAVPQAVRCTECQGTHERLLKMRLTTRPQCGH